MNTPIDLPVPPSTYPEYGLIEAVPDNTQQPRIVAGALTKAMLYDWQQGLNSHDTDADCPELT